MVDNTMQLLPNQRHFDSVQELMDEFKKASDAQNLPFENDVNKPFYTQDEGSFETVLSRKGDKVLIPNSHSYPILYRGQTIDYGSCQCSLFRETHNEVAIFIERMRQIEFEHIIRTHPVVENFFLKNGFRVSFAGLAQHYGLKTDMLDLTIDLAVALFFATCQYNKAIDNYEPVVDEKKHTGVIYAVTILNYFDSGFENFFDNKLQVIGLQPFNRPGLQKGFVVSLKPEEDLKACKYTFSYTRHDSDYFYEKFNKGNVLWGKDELADLAEPIAKQCNFSRKTFAETFEIYRPKGFSRTKMIDSLNDYNIVISHKYAPARYPEQKCLSAIERWNSVQVKDFCHQVQHKFWNEEGHEENKVGKRHEFRTLAMLGEIEMLRRIGSTYKDTSNVHQEKAKLPSPIVKKRNSNYDSGWKKVPTRYELEKAVPYLDESKCKIDLKSVRFLTKV